MCIIMEKKHPVEIVSLVLLFILTTWWVVLFFGYKASLEFPNLVWAASYQVVAMWGVVWGFIMGHRWGGFRSIVGRSIYFFAFGLLCQVVGQSVFSIYGIFLQREIPYPSIAYFGFFGSIFLYIIAVVELGRAAGAGSLLKSFTHKAWATILPLCMLIGSYAFFLRDYQFDWSQPIKIVLDFGYPLGQATYVSLAILVYLLSKNFLGGIMKTKVLIVLVALIIQYIADFNFLYQFDRETWINGGYGDFLYLISYFVMSFGLIQLGTTLEKI